MIDVLECCKQHGRLFTAKDMEQFKSFTESEIIAEAVFLKKTTVPNIGLKHKVRSKYVKYTSRCLYHFQ